MSGISPGVEPNDGWRNKPISEKQAELLHDLSCAMFAMMSRGEASDMIAKMLESQKARRFTDQRRRLPDKRRRPRGNLPSYDRDTLEDNK